MVNFLGKSPRRTVRVVLPVEASFSDAFGALDVQGFGYIYRQWMFSSRFTTPQQPLSNEAINLLARLYATELYPNLPHWLTEGFAVSFESVLGEPEDTASIQFSTKLDGGPGYYLNAEQLGQSEVAPDRYRESAAAWVQFLLDQYPEDLSGLLEAVARGDSFNEAWSELSARRGDLYRQLNAWVAGRRRPAFARASYAPAFVDVRAMTTTDYLLMRSVSCLFSKKISVTADRNDRTRTDTASPFRTNELFCPLRARGYVVHVPTRIGTRVAAQ
ncbi:MAG: hypothetical protein AAFV36_02695 [Myxococcota bacterium]